MRDQGINHDIVGVFPYLNDNNSEAYSKEIKRYENCTESLIVNTRVLLANNVSIIVLVTRPSANHGKTLTSRKFAMGFAKIGYKTLLMDCDLKQGDMHKFLDRSSIKTSDLYESQDSSNYEKL